MKVVIVSPPKSGANRLRCLIATLYGLRAVDARDAPDGSSPPELANWLESLPGDCVTHTDLPFDPALPAMAENLGVTFVAIVRHPFDLFVSNRNVKRNREQRASRRARPRGIPETASPSAPSTVPEYHLDAFGNDVQTMLDWSSAAAATARYEAIVDRPETVLSALAGILGNIEEPAIARAVKLCPAEPRIVSSGNRGVRMTEIPPGSWQTLIDAELLQQMQRQFQESVTRLGYE